MNRAPVHDLISGLSQAKEIYVHMAVSQDDEAPKTPLFGGYLVILQPLFFFEFAVFQPLTHDSQVVFGGSF